MPYSRRRYPLAIVIDPTQLDRLVSDVMPTVVEARRTIHANPELSGEEFATTDYLVSTLRAHGLDPRVRTPKTGLIQDLGPGGRGVAFRADIDALPIAEPEGLVFRSARPGVMHACGHDAHTAIGLGATLAMAKLELPSRVRFIFQPAEETFPGGAYELVREGVLDGMRSLIAFHVDPGLETGSIGLKAGPVTSSADRFYITLEGPGGHTARPHATVDLIYAAAQVIAQLPAMLDRLLDARSPVAVVFGQVHGGTADNVIPTVVELSGTLRTADRELWDEIPALAEQIVHNAVAPLGAKVLVHYQRGIPPVVNDPEVIRRVEIALRSIMDADAIVPTHVSMGAEDLARYLEVIPGALLRLGCKVPGLKVDLHSTGFAIDEACLEVGVRAAVAATLELAS